MKIFVPHYYKDFNCKAGECRHSCCEHWEIDIDPDTMEKYNNLATDFGDKIRASIESADGCYSFKLGKNERCPFLNSDNLCDIILNLGEDYICDICADHPRFRNFYSDRIEIGLGLCCEEACRLILNDNKPFSLKVYDETEENLPHSDKSFFCKRNAILKAFDDAITDDVFSVIKNIADLEATVNLNFNENTAFDFYSDLEMLDTAWQSKLARLKSPETALPNENAVKMFRNLYKYFIFRHLSEENFCEGIVFSEISVKMIWAICERTDFTEENICEIARMYSSEIEYSDENVEKVIDFAMSL